MTYVSEQGAAARIPDMVRALSAQFSERDSRGAMQHLIQTGELVLTLDFKLVRRSTQPEAKTSRDAAVWGMLTDALEQRERVRIEQAKDGRGVLVRVGHRSVQRDTLEAAVRAAYSRTFDD